MNVFLSAVCVSIPDTLPCRVALVGHSGELGNTLIVGSTGAFHVTPPAAAAFITKLSVRLQTRREEAL